MTYISNHNASAQQCEAATEFLGHEPADCFGLTHNVIHQAEEFEDVGAPDMGPRINHIPERHVPCCFNCKEEIEAFQGWVDSVSGPVDEFEVEIA